mgnify:CR=1 FL=1
MATYKSIAYNVPLKTAAAAAGPQLLSTVTCSSDSTISFTSGIDDSYNAYLIKFINIHPSSTSNPKFTFQVDTGTNTSYNIAVTSTAWYAYHDEADSETGLSYYAGGDQQQGTAFHRLTAGSVGADNDQSVSGELMIFEPSSGTYVKMFQARTSLMQDNDSTNDYWTAGYFNTTTAITRVQFKMDDGDMDTGTFKLYGVN